MSGSSPTSAISAISTVTLIAPSTSTQPLFERSGSARRVTAAGPTLNNASAKPIAKMNIRAMAQRPSSTPSSPSSPSAAYSVEMASARKPIASDSPSAITPLMTGSLKTRCRFIKESTGRQTSATSPLGLRTASDQYEGLRIITPSITAWPPYIVVDCLASRGSERKRRRRFLLGFTVATRTLGLRDRKSIFGLRLVGASCLFGLFEPALEALDTAAGVDELLLARVEGMAGRADLDVELGLYRARLKLVTAGATNDRAHVFGMDISLHQDRGYQRRYGAPRCHRRQRQ